MPPLSSIWKKPQTTLLLKKCVRTQPSLAMMKYTNLLNEAYNPQPSNTSLSTLWEHSTPYWHANHLSFTQCDGSICKPQRQIDKEHHDSIYFVPPFTINMLTNGFPTLISTTLIPNFFGLPCGSRMHNYQILNFHYNRYMGNACKALIFKEGS